MDISDPDSMIWEYEAPGDMNQVVMTQLHNVQSGAPHVTVKANTCLDVHIVPRHHEASE